MITPDVMKKIEDKRREKTRTDGQGVPAHQDLPNPPPHAQDPKKQEDPDKNPSRVIEISIS